MFLLTTLLYTLITQPSIYYTQQGVDKKKGYFNEIYDTIKSSEIEKLWSDLNKSTSKSYSDMVSAYLSTLDEKAVIKAKK